MVLFSWLAAIVLHMNAFYVGLAQVALMAPGILFLPLGGLVADRGNPRRLLMRYHVLYALPPLVLGVVLAGGIAVWRLPDPPSHPPHPPTSFWRSVAEGVSAAAQSDQMWPVLLINFGVGVFYVGPFMAVLPIAVRDHYHGGSAELSYMNLAFWAATIVAAMAFATLARRLILRGRLIAVAVTMGGGVLVTLSTLPPFPVFVALIFVWGIGAGITMTQSRTVLQIMAPPSHRARLMSLFQLGIGGGGPIGAFIAGSIGAVWGIRTAMLLPACAMLLAILVIVLRSRLLTMRTVE